MAITTCNISPEGRGQVSRVFVRNRKRRYRRGVQDEGPEDVTVGGPAMNQTTLSPPLLERRAIVMPIAEFGNSGHAPPDSGTVTISLTVTEC